MDYKDFYKQIQTRSFRDLYLFTGAESFIANSMLDQAIDCILEKDERAFNLVELKSNELEFEEFESAVNTLPFFAGRKVIVVRNTAIFNSAHWSDAHLKKFKSIFDIKNQSPNIVFFLSENVDARNKFYKACKALGEIVVYDKITQSELVAWITKQFAHHGTKISKSAINALAIGSGYLNSELDVDLYKLDSIINALAMEHKGLSIDEMLIKQRFYDDKTVNVFKLIDSVFNNEKNAYADLEWTLKHGSSHIYLLFLFHKHIRQLLRVKICLEQKKNVSQIENELGLKSFVVKKLVNQCNHFHKDKLYAFLHLSSEIDFHFKNRGVIAGESDRLLSLLVFEILDRA